MPRSNALKTALAAAAMLALGLALQGCVVTSVAGAAVGVTATAVKTTTKVAGTAVGVGADAVGAVGKAATGGH